MKNSFSYRKKNFIFHHSLKINKQRVPIAQGRSEKNRKLIIIPPFIRHLRVHFALLKELFSLLVLILFKWLSPTITNFFLKRSNLSIISFLFFFLYVYHFVSIFQWYNYLVFCFDGLEFCFCFDMYLFCFLLFLCLFVCWYIFRSVKTIYLI